MVTIIAGSRTIKTRKQRVARKPFSAGVADLTGRRFGKLLVVKYLGTGANALGHYRSSWECLCDCGKTILKRRDALKVGMISSCGCNLKAPRKDPRLTGLNRLFSSYKSNATMKGYQITLTLEQFDKIISQNCFYCNRPPQSIVRVRNGHGLITYNGIDRKDNSLGYINGNCLPCCTECNYMKRSQDYNSFIDKIRTIYKTVCER